MMYEAALNRDPQAIRQLLASYWDEGADYLSPMEINEDTPFGFCENELQFALYGAIALVEWEVRDLCEWWVVFEGNDHTPDPSTVELVDGFKNLLGAMYLQMYLLIGSGGDVTRCEYCGRIISLARPYPKGRKRRRDKRFCDDACRQANHRSKPKA